MYFNILINNIFYVKEVFLILKKRSSNNYIGYI